MFSVNCCALNYPASAERLKGPLARQAVACPGTGQSQAMFWIRDVLIGIRIPGSVLLEYGTAEPGPDPAVFFSDFHDANKM